MVQAANLGFPRIGAKRELKRSLEAFWRGDATEQELQETAKTLRVQNWKRQKDAGIAVIPSNDFSFYDQILDMIMTTGAMPERYKPVTSKGELATYFAMARGYQNDGVDVTAMEMTKWFDTNYHYIVPEFDAATDFTYTSKKAVNEFMEAKAAGIDTQPVIIGPVTFLLLGKARDGSEPLALLDKLLPVYAELLAELKAEGATDVQIDEPFLALDLPAGAAEAYGKAYDYLNEKAAGLKLLVATYFAGLNENTALAANLPVAGLHVDLVRAPEQLDDVLAALPSDKILSVGVIDGRNIWRTDLTKAFALVEKAAAKHGSDNLRVAPSCSLLHSPVDVSFEEKLDADIKGWLAFAQQKLEEIALLTRHANGEDVSAAWEAHQAHVTARQTSAKVHNAEVKARVDGVSDDMYERRSSFNQRKPFQKVRGQLPLFPTTTIGSFPQTSEVRRVRAAFKKGEMDVSDYEDFIKNETKDCLKKQEDIGLDVLVHGEFERNDMVEYFGEQLSGFAFTQNGWVQSYGSRCVKPPVIFGDVSRPKPMTVTWTKFAQSQTDKPVKGMLTGPVTILQWSFVRDDQSDADTCRQIALAIRDEVLDLEEAGVSIIQIDEAALREGLPLRKAEQANYLDWAVGSFQLSAAGVNDETQVHTHMCYSEFNDIIEAVAKMDADAISIETSRSAMELLDAFVSFKYPNEIGPGVYDIHSPRVPAQDEMEHLLEKALERLSTEQVWVNPDCGLKTRGWKEVEPALKAMVDAAKTMRGRYADAAAA